jgi:hypothetical protein
MAILQRFGAALNLNVHVHALVLDGVYVEAGMVGCAFTHYRHRLTKRWIACSSR